MRACHLDRAQKPFDLEHLTPISGRFAMAANLPLPRRWLGLVEVSRMKRSQQPRRSDYLPSAAAPTRFVSSFARWRVIVIAMTLALVSIAIYAPTFWVPYDFVAYDDQEYVEGNVMVASGLNAHGLRWALTHSVAGYWHPLTIVSHMLDVELYGLEPAGHHLTNVLLHAANGAILFLVFANMTRAVWPSACVAALFAWHPLRVESVAWVAERKDVLSACFMFLALGAYTWYARRGGWTPYLVTTLLFVLGLLSKPMLVTFPCVVLLLDLWPLARWNPRTWRERTGQIVFARLIVEKMPWLALSATVVVTTLVSEVGAYSDLTLSARLANSINSYYGYLALTFYPYPLFLPRLGIDFEPSLAWTVLGTVSLALITLLAVAAAARWPYITMGWLWYLGILVPVIGIVQVGVQSMADRYTYVPSIGIYVIVAWSLAAVATRNRAWYWACVLAAVAVLPPLVTLSMVQVTRWRDSETLFGYTLQHSPQNYVAYISLGVDALNHERYELALVRASRAAELSPAERTPSVIAATALARLRRTQEAIAVYSLAIELNPDAPTLLNDLARILATADDPRFRNGEAALRLARLANDQSAGDNPLILDTMAAAYAELGAWQAAIDTASQALALMDDSHEKIRPLRAGLQRRMALYRQQQPFHVPGGVWDE